MAHPRSMLILETCPRAVSVLQRKRDVSTRSDLVVRDRKCLERVLLISSPGNALGIPLGIRQAILQTNDWERKRASSSCGKAEHGFQATYVSLATLLRSEVALVQCKRRHA